MDSCISNSTTQVTCFSQTTYSFMGGSTGGNIKALPVLCTILLQGLDDSVCGECFASAGNPTNQNDLCDIRSLIGHISNRPVMCPLFSFIQRGRRGRRHHPLKWIIIELLFVHCQVYLQL